MIYIGIDPGTKTGIAVWDKYANNFRKIETTGIVRAMMDIYDLHDYEASGLIEVVIEDARKRKWFGNSGREKLQGAGSIKRDCAIWEEFCKEIGVQYRFVAPKDIRTKLKSDSFKNITKWNGKTDQHGRDAAMLVYGITNDSYLKQLKRA